MKKLVFRSIMIISLFALFIATDRYCYLAKGFSIFNYRMKPFSTFDTRLRVDHNSTSPYYFCNEKDNGYYLDTNLEFQSVATDSSWVTHTYEQPTTIRGVNGDTIIHIQCITKYGYNKKQFVFFCETDTNEKWIIKPVKEGKQYVNMAINADDIQKQEYSWIDLFDFKSFILPCIWVALCLIIPFDILAYLVWVDIFLREKSVNKNDLIGMRSHFYYLDPCILMFRDLSLIFVFVLGIAGYYIGFIHLLIAFLLVEIVILTLFFYHMRYPVSFIYNGNKYVRINAYLKKQLDVWHPVVDLISTFRLFLYAFGSIKTIIIAKCRETGDIKVQCPYCKHIMNVEDVPYRCPQCNKRMHNNVYYVSR
ncbi:MAG: hypothetical protein SOY26_04230 [Paludibacteraceae bacterium]|nr:hypothetical protein [Paludibacteraceae bacterium]